MFQVTRRFRSLSVVAIVVLTLTNVLVSLRLLNVSCSESSPGNSLQPSNHRLATLAPKHVTKPVPQHRQHILTDVGAEEVAIAAPCTDVGADQAAPVPAESPKPRLLNVDLRLGRWDSRRLYRLFDHVLVGDRFAELSDNSKVTLATQTSVERMQSVVQMALHWGGPLSVALFAAGEEDRLLLQAQLKFIQKCYPKIASQISFHLAFPREPRPVSKDPAAMEMTSNSILNLKEKQLQMLNFGTRNLPNTEDSLDAMQAHLDCQQPEQAFKDIMTFWRPNASHWKAKNLYPQNHMRNLARRNCQTSFVFLTDVDIVPCFNLWERLDAFLATVPEPGPGSLSSPAEATAKETRSGRGGLPFRRPPPTKVPSPKVAYVIPTFEVDKRSRFPRTKKEVIRLSSRGLARPFHQKVFIFNQYATNFSRWQSEHDPDDASVRVAYNVTNFEFLYEPFYVAPDTVPGHDERFVGYGFTRNTQVYEMSVAGYQFQVLSPVFAVHWGLQTKTSRPTWREMQNSENRRHVDAFKAEIAARYGVPLSKPSPPAPPSRKKG